MTKRTPWAHVLGLLALSLGLLAPAAGQAQTADPRRMSAAQALYSQASAEMAAKNYASACVKLEEVTRLIPDGLGAKMTLGECYEGLGKLASAWSQYTVVHELAANAGQSARAAQAEKKAAALRPRLASLIIDVPAAVRVIAGLSITRDDEPIGEGQWATPVPVDSGPHEIVVTAPGRKRSIQRVDVPQDGGQVSFTVTAPEVDPSKALPPPSSSSATAAPPLADTAAPPVRPWQRSAGLVAMGVGVAGVGLGAVLGGLAVAKKAESNEDSHCYTNNRCDATGLELRESARTLGTASTVALIAGGAVLAGGFAVFVMAPPSCGRPERMGKRRALCKTQVGLAPGGIELRGAW